MPMQEAGKGQEPGAAGNFLVGKTDLDGFIGCLEFNEFGHCWVSRFVGRLGEFYHTPTSLYQLWPQLLLHRYGLGSASKIRRRQQGANRGCCQGQFDPRQERRRMDCQEAIRYFSCFRWA